jgi:toxin-antitoxin system PIN domain toxin
MTALLDAAVLIALFDEAHVHHRAAHEWMNTHRAKGWASCPITQNACIRIMSQPAYPGRLSVADITRRLRKATAASDHQFWPDSLSLCNKQWFDPSVVLLSKQITDLYLLALAVHRKGYLVTFDRGVNTDAIPMASQEHLVVLGR